MSTSIKILADSFKLSKKAKEEMRWNLLLTVLNTPQRYVLVKSEKKKE